MNTKNKNVMRKMILDDWFAFLTVAKTHAGSDPDRRVLGV